MQAKPMSSGKIAQLLDFICAPKQGERMLFLTDYFSPSSPHERSRALLVSRWFSAAAALSQEKGFVLLPLVLYRQTGKDNAELPKTASTQGGGHVADLAELVKSANMAIAMTEYSASAPLKNLAAASRSLRLVSMPGVTADMEPAMAADYARIEKRGNNLLAIVKNAAGFEFTFDGSGVPRGTRLFIDTRASNWLLDAALCRKAGGFINFPSGELFSPPYEGVSPEGRRELGDSQTSGIWPVYSHSDNKVAFLKVEKNRIVRVQGDSALARSIIEDIAADENAANVAEVAFGLNDSARSGEGVPILEKEKSGPHIAYGRNDHFGTPLTLAGKVKANVHRDFVYTRDTPITATVYAIFPNGNRVLIAERGKVVAV